MAVKIGKNAGNELVLGAVTKSNENESVEAQSSDTGMYSLKKPKEGKNLPLQLIANILASKDVKNFDKYRPTDMALSDGDSDLFSTIESFILNYGTLPTQEQLDDHMESKQLEPIALPIPQEDGTESLPYLRAKVLEQAADVKLTGYLKRCAIQREEKIPAIERVSDLFDGLTKVQRLDPLSRYVTPEEGMKNASITGKKSMMLKDAQGIKLGWDGFDDLTHGILGGNVVVVAARPSVGKTWVALNAAKAAYHQGKRSKVISMEMTTEELWIRFLAMETGIEAKKIRHGTSDKEYAKIKAARVKFEEMQDNGKFLTMHQPLGRYTPEDLLLECRRDGIDFLVVDAAYMLDHKDPYVNKSQWDKLREVINQIKLEVAVPLDIPVVCTYQLNKEVDKYASHEDINLDNLYGGDTTAQVASIVMAIWQDDGLNANSRRYIKLLKGRNGEANLGGFEINWRFQTMDFSQYEPQQLDQLPL